MCWGDCLVGKELAAQTRSCVKARCGQAHLPLHTWKGRDKRIHGAHSLVSLGDLLRCLTPVKKIRWEATKLNTQC